MGKATRRRTQLKVRDGRLDAAQLLVRECNGDIGSGTGGGAWVNVAVGAARWCRVYR